MDIEAQMRRLDEEFELREKSRLERLMKNNTSHLSQISLDLHESAASEQPYSPASKLLVRESISRRASGANRPSVSMARGSISRGSIRGRRESVANRLSVAPAQSPDFKSPQRRCTTTPFKRKVTVPISPHLKTEIRARKKREMLLSPSAQQTQQQQHVERELQFSQEAGSS